MFARTSGPKTDEVTGGCTLIRRSIVCTVRQILLRRSDYEDEMGGACSESGDEKCIQNFGWKAWTEDLGVDGSIILKRMLG
jgi:hypothetical protein